jgi:hypothetical protein
MGMIVAREKMKGWMYLRGAWTRVRERGRG